MSKYRSLLILVFILFFSAVVILRLFSLQVLSYKDYKTLAENQHQAYKTLVPVRGEIFVKEGRNGKLVPVATNIERNLVFAVPPEISDKEKTAAVLAPVLEMTKSEILEKISDNERKWAALKKGLTESASLRINDLKLPGIYLQPETHRLYPENIFASHILGFLGFSGNQRIGQYGVEEYFEEELGGKPGSLLQERDLRGRWIASGLRQIEEAVDGADVVLTIDRAVQFKAENLLKEGVLQFEADSASMVVLEPKTGAVLAIANVPSFDPNSFSAAEDFSVFRNAAVSDAYEPGSVFKPITMAAGLDSGAITPDTTYEDTGSVTIGEFTIRNANNRTYGIQTMTQVLEQSINTGAIFVVNEVGDRKFLDTVQNFGFGKPTGLKLPAESAGNIQNLRGGGEVHYSTASFGQGITATPLQLAQAFGAIANQGKLVKPRIVESVQYADGRLENFTPEDGGQVISSKAANTLSAMLVSVVENGHGKRAGVPGYYVAGKTGTAQVAKPGGGYDPDVTIGTFAGFAPVENPAFVVVVKMVNPKAVRFAESTAAPIFGDMARFLLNYYQIPPTR